MSQGIDYAKEYDNSARVEGADQIINAYIQDAANFREEPNRIADYDLIYGPQPRNQIDVFWPNDELGEARRSPIVMFIHGGYWQRLDRSSFSHMARGLNARGIAVAIPSYTLCPDITVENIINEMRRACLVLYQTYKKRITVIGHSAGGHLAACMLATDWEAIHSELPHDLVASAMGISGLYDLMPMLLTPINDALQMDEQQAHAASPIHWVPEASQKFEAWVGADESSEFHRQSRDITDRWSLLGTPTTYVSVAGKNHFTIIHDLVQADSQMVERIVELSEKPIADFSLPDVDENILKTLVQDFSEPAKKSKPKKRKSSKAQAQKKEQPKASIGGKAPPRKEPLKKPARKRQSNQADTTEPK